MADNPKRKMVLTLNEWIAELKAENKALKESLDDVTKQNKILLKGMELYTTKESVEKYIAHYKDKE